MNEDVKSENLRIHSRADELIACLEGEIAKRDEELAAFRVAVENCEVFRARIAELEAQYQRDVCGLNNEGDPIGGDPAGGYANDNARLRAKLAALKAQEPATNDESGLEAWAAGKFGVGGAFRGELCGNTDWALARLVWSAALAYAAPVSEAKAQCVVMPERAIKDGGKFSTELKVTGWNACLDAVARLNAAPVQQVSVPVVCTCGSEYPAGSYGAGFIIGSGMCEICDAAMPPKDIPQMVSVPDGKVCVPVEVLRLYEFMAASFTPFTSQHEQIAISLRKAKAAMLADAPAAPAADAGLVEALKQAFPLFDEDGLNELYHHCEIAVLGDRKRLHKLLATHSAKGVV